MTIKTGYNKESEIYFVHCQGVQEKGVNKTFIKKVAEDCDKNHCNKILVESNKHYSEMDPSDIIERMQFIMSAGFDPSTMIAIITDFKEKNNFILETSAANRGILLKTFKNTKEAVTWLK